MKYNELIQLYFERSNALQGYWTLYVLIIGGLLAFSSLRKQPDLVTGLPDPPLSVLSPRGVVGVRLRRSKITLSAFVICIVFLVLAVISPLLTRFGVLDPYTGNLKLDHGVGPLPESYRGEASSALPP